LSGAVPSRSGLSGAAPEQSTRVGALTGVGAFDPGRRGVRALAALAVLVIVVAAVLAWRSRPRIDPVTAAPESVTETGTPPAPGTSSEPSGEVVVAVAGKIRRPGLVRLPTGARVADALQAAGGVRPGTDPSLLNLARKVVDGELLLVGVTPPPGAPVGGASRPGGAAPAGGAPAGGPVNLNTATLADLDTLPGVGPVLAQRILDHRDQHGGFKTVADLRRVNGIGNSRYEQLKDLVTV
jgi:competence protein ComEA